MFGKYYKLLTYLVILLNIIFIAGQVMGYDFKEIHLFLLQSKFYFCITFAFFIWNFFKFVASLYFGIFNRTLLEKNLYQRHYKSYNGSYNYDKIVQSLYLISSKNSHYFIIGDLPYEFKNQIGREKNASVIFMVFENLFVVFLAVLLIHIF